VDPFKIKEVFLLVVFVLFDQHLIVRLQVPECSSCNEQNLSIFVGPGPAVDLDDVFVLAEDVAGVLVVHLLVRFVLNSYQGKSLSNIVVIFRMHVANLILRGVLGAEGTVYKVYVTLASRASLY